MSRRDRRARATGRASSPSLRHVRLHHFLLRSPAWRELDCYARAALVELYSIYNGENNGEIGMSERRLAGVLNCSRPTARTALRQLREHGFIRVRERGSFNRKIPHATEWILTEFPVGSALPSKDFMRWTPAENRAVKFSRVKEVYPPGKGGLPAQELEGPKNAVAGQ